MMGRVALEVEIGRLLDRAEPLLATAATTAAAVAIRDRLEEPLRVAIAGRVKAGKSTLLNALIGERLAPTDAGECTKVVTWYRHGLAYDVTAVLDDGERRPVRFEREDGRLLIDLGRLTPSQIERLDVSWPAARLRRFTLIDTPGLEAHDEASAGRTLQLLGADGAGTSQVDAVIYLMRHLHRLDVEFLDAFADRSVPYPSPVNAIAVLSRADEIGAGRLDALTSADHVAQRYRTDARMRALCATVVPVAGLIAETGRTLREQEGASLRAIADLGEDEKRLMLLSVDRFTDPDRSPIDSETRRDLLLRLGLFGVRFGIDQVGGKDATASDLARSLVDASGIDRFAGLLDEHFAGRAALLKSRSAIAATKALVSDLAPSLETAQLMNDIERIETGSSELGELKLLHLAVSGLAGFNDHERGELDRLVDDTSPESRLGLMEGTDPETLRSLVLERLANWRDEAAFPLATSERREACELIAALYERLHADLAG